MFSNVQSSPYKRNSELEFLRLDMRVIMDNRGLFKHDLVDVLA